MNTGQMIRTDKRINGALPSSGHTTEHRKSVPYSEVSAVIRAIRAIPDPTWSGKKLALEFLIHTGMRSNEVTGMRWTEIDWQSETWTCPAARMKKGGAHRVPLSAAALSVLKSAWKMNPTGLAFRSCRGGQIERLVDVMRRLQRTEDVHGFRGSLRNWCAENGIDDSVAELCIAHYPSDSTVKAYLTTDRLNDRRAVMQRWSEFVTGSK